MVTFGMSFKAVILFEKRKGKNTGKNQGRVRTLADLLALRYVEAWEIKPLAGEQGPLRKPVKARKSSKHSEKWLRIKELLIIDREGL